MRKALPFLMILVLVGCVPFKRMVTKEYGRDGWELDGMSPSKGINAVRGMNQSVWILRVDNEPQKFLVKITPSSQPMDTPPWSSHDHSTSCAIVYDCRTYKIPPGKSFSDVYDWYVKWFDFKPR